MTPKATQNPAHFLQNPTSVADWVEWLEACPLALDGETRAGILAMVRAAGTGVDWAQR